MRPRDIWLPIIALGLFLVILVDPCVIKVESKENETSGQAFALSSKTGEDNNVPKVHVVMLDFDEQYFIEQEKTAVAAYLAALETEWLAVEAYLDGLYQEQLARQRPQTSRSTVISGDCAGVAVIIGSGTVQRESGGNPLAENGIYKGCGQIGMPWWNGACSGLDWTNPFDQAICAHIVMGIQGPSAWATTYGG
jgi:hypothetical protein